jgi:cysteine-rich repeat protein
MPGCAEVGPYCGDGEIYDGAELCDDANDVDNDACSNACGADKCAELQVKLTPLPPKVAMVLDKSGSMVSNKWDHDADANTLPITRWASLHGVVTFILNNFQAKLDLGLVLYPSKAATQTYNAMACIVSQNPEVGCAPNNKNPILAAMPGANATNIYGGTPASSGMITALNHLKTFDQQFTRSVILVTDGAANCKLDAQTEQQRFEVYDQALHDVVGNAFNNDNIATYIIGIDISKVNTGGTQDGNPDNIVPFNKLNELAVAGGKPKNDPAEKFYAASNQIELQEALELVANDALSCIVALEEPPIFPQNTKVKIGPDLVPKLDTCDGQDGWVYVGDPPTAIELCGSWCEQLKITQQIDVEYYCKPG